LGHILLTGLQLYYLEF